MEEKTLDQMIAEIVNEALTCARQADKWRAPFACIIDLDGKRSFIKSVGRFRTPLEAEDLEERAGLFSELSKMQVGERVETRNKNNCSQKHEYRDSWTRTESGWKHEELKGSNRHGY